VFNNRVYVGALDGNLYCLDADTGAVIWQFAAGLHIMATPTIVDNAIYIPVTTEVPNGTVYKLDMAGNVIWQKEIPYNLTLTAGDGGYMLASATVAEGMVFVRSALRANYALNATTGDIIWTYDARYNPGTPFQSGGVHQFMPMLYKYGALYFNDYYGITCLDAANGTEIWHTYLSRESLAQGVSYAYKRIYTVTEFGVLFVLDALSGEKLSYYEFSPAGQMRCTPIPYNGNLYVGTCEWTMFCFGEARLMGSASQSSVSASTSMPIESTSTGLSEAPLITTELAILAAVVVACLITIASYLTLRKRK
jgi:outer membrane protein assembly factor BamB